MSEEFKAMTNGDLSLLVHQRKAHDLALIKAGMTLVANALRTDLGGSMVTDWLRSQLAKEIEAKRDSLTSKDLPTL